MSAWLFTVHSSAAISELENFIANVDQTFLTVATSYEKQVVKHKVDFLAKQNKTRPSHFTAWQWISFKYFRE